MTPSQKTPAYLIESILSKHYTDSDSVSQLRDELIVLLQAERDRAQENIYEHLIELQEKLRTAEEAWKTGQQEIEEAKVILEWQRTVYKPAMERIKSLEDAIINALNELGVPTPDYPAPIVNAVVILRALLQPSASPEPKKCHECGKPRIVPHTCAPQPKQEEAMEIVRDLATWSKKWPKNNLNNWNEEKQCHAELNAIEDRAKVMSTPPQPVQEKEGPSV